MRRRLVFASALALLLAGCAEEPSLGPGADEPAAPVVAFVDMQEENGRNRTLLVVREGGAAERLTYVHDGSWVARLAPDLAYPRADLDLVFAESPSKERGGLVFRIERGGLPENATEALRPFLESEWPAPFLPEGDPHPWYRPTVYGRAAPLALTESPPDGKQHLQAEHARLGELIDAFDLAARAFEAASVEEAPGLEAPEWDGCLRASTRATPGAARVGEVVEVEARVTNCGSQSVTIDFARCRDPPGVTVQLGGSLFPFLAALPASEEPGAAYALDLVCRGDAEPLSIPPGDTATLTRRWNGTIAACRTADDCDFRAAEPAEYAFVTYASGQRETMPASFTLLAEDPDTTRFLLVREHDWVNTTSSGALMGDFGPHCAPVGYRLDPAAVTLWYYGERPALPKGVIVRDWREGERPSHVMTMSADRLDVELVHAEPVVLASPFNGTLPLAEVVVDGEDFLVNGTRLAPGETTTMRFEHTFETREGTFEAASILVFENVGAADVLYARAGGCA